MSKLEALIYVCMAFVIVLLLPLDETPLVCIGGLTFAGALLGIVAWNALNDDLGTNDD